MHEDVQKYIQNFSWKKLSLSSDRHTWQEIIITDIEET
jgi:hypothetical protein